MRGSLKCVPGFFWEKGGGEGRGEDLGDSPPILIFPFPRPLAISTTFPETRQKVEKEGY